MDIREWAKGQPEWSGRVSERGRLSAELRDAYEAAQTTPGQGPDDDDGADDPVFAVPLVGLPSGGGPGTGGQAPPGPPPEERRPVPPPKPRGRARWQRKPAQPVRRGERKRVSIENLISGVWGAGAYFLARDPRSLPVARVLDAQAPVAGLVVEELAAHTVVDRVLQPIARMGESGQRVFALVGPPLIVGAISANPSLFPMLREPLKAALMQWAEIAEPAMKRAQKRSESFAERFGGVDLDAMIDGFFAPPPGDGLATAPSDQEEENIRRARGQQS